MEAVQFTPMKYQTIGHIFCASPGITNILLFFDSRKLSTFIRREWCPRILSWSLVFILCQKMGNFLLIVNALFSR